VLTFSALQLVKFHFRILCFDPFTISIINYLFIQFGLYLQRSNALIRRQILLFDLFLPNSFPSIEEADFFEVAPLFFSPANVHLLFLSPQPPPSTLHTVILAKPPLSTGTFTNKTHQMF
jgi:hypothetical protein